jgi:hypothetical protein
MSQKKAGAPCMHARKLAVAEEVVEAVEAPDLEAVIDTIIVGKVVAIDVGVVEAPEVELIRNTLRALPSCIIISCMGVVIRPCIQRLESAKNVLKSWSNQLFFKSLSKMTAAVDVFLTVGKVSRHRVFTIKSAL